MKSSTVATPISETVSDAPQLAFFDKGVTLRVVILSLFLAAFFGVVIPIFDVRFSNTYLGSVHFPPGAVGVLFLLVMATPLLRIVNRRLAFSRNEALTIYIVSLFACIVPGHGSEVFFVSNLIGSFYYATRENGWLKFLEGLPHWMSPALSGSGHYDEAAQKVVGDWYVGNGGAVPWSAWLTPLLAWGALILSMYVMLGCLGVMLRAQWAQREALAFPLLRLPLEMTADLNDSKGLDYGRFFRNPAMWVGFGIVVFVQGLNGLNLYFPDVPVVPLNLNAGAFFTETPWNQMAVMGITISPLMLGITFLLTAEVSLSLWSFIWFIQFQLILSYYLGYLPATLPSAIGHVADGGAKSFQAYQQCGAFLMYAGVVFWIGREHFSHIAKRAFGRAPRTPAENSELISYPAAFWGFFIALAFILAWSVAAGIRLDIAIVMWGAYLVIAVVMTRVVAEGGMFYVQQGWTTLGTLAQLTNSGAGSWLAGSSVVPATFVQGALMTDMRAFLLPTFLHSFKLAHDQRIAKKPLLFLIAAVILITFSLGIWMRVRMGYQLGALSFNAWFAVVGPQQPAVNAQALLSGAQNVSWTNAIWMAVGAAIIYLMMLARSRLLWFPLHPIGFLVALSPPIQRLWVSIFLGWLAKVLITRFGGTETYRKAVPFFLGLILGDVTMMVFWLTLDYFQNRQGHMLMPG